MSVLPNKTKECFQAIKAAIQDRIAGLEGDRKTYTRMRYADNLNQWLEIAAVVISDETRLQVVFIYLYDFKTARKNFTVADVTATFAIEVIYQFREGDENSNSTLDFENELGDINDIFLEEEALGFTDVSSNPVINSPITGDPATGAKPEYVDGVLAHRKILYVDATFRVK